MKINSETSSNTNIVLDKDSISLFITANKHLINCQQWPSNYAKTINLREPIYSWKAIKKLIED